MKVVIFGANGGVGSHLLTRALAAGHQVRASVRQATSIKQTHARLEVVEANALDLSSVEQAVAGQDAVLDALGNKLFAKNYLETPALENFLTAMEKQSVARLITISAYNVDPKLQSWLSVKLGNATALKIVAADKRSKEKLLQKSQLNWTVVRPMLLYNGAKSKPYTINNYNDAHWYSRISRENVADFMLNQLVDERYLQQTVLLHE